MQFTRYGIYYTPPRGALADFGAGWLGWDIERGCAVAHPEIEGLPHDIAPLTQTPRKYGLHGTIKPPFRLAEGKSAAMLEQNFDDLAQRLPPIALEGLALTRLGGFVALTVQGDQSPLADVASAIVRGLDAFRAPPSDAELARRRKADLTPRQEELLAQWGYPYVMDQFRFHITLTGKLGTDDAAQVTTALTPHFVGLLPSPFEIRDLTLVGEDDTGMFHEIHRTALSG